MSIATWMHAHEWHCSCGRDISAVIRATPNLELGDFVVCTACYGVHTITRSREMVPYLVQVDLADVSAEDAEQLREAKRQIERQRGGN